MISALATHILKDTTLLHVGVHKDAERAHPVKNGMAHCQSWRTSSWRRALAAEGEMRGGSLHKSERMGQDLEDLGQLDGVWSQGPDG